MLSRLRAAWKAFNALQRQDQAKHDEGLAAVLTPRRKEIIDALEAFLFRVGATETVERIGAAVQERYENERITQLVVRKHLKQVEFGEELVDALRAGRGGPALAVTRTLLEGGVELAWTADPNLSQPPKDRLLRILRAAYAEMAEHMTPPPGEQAILDQAVAQGLKLPPKMRNAMEEMDAAEVRNGGTPYWDSHYQHFRVASGYSHPTFFGPGKFSIEGDYIHVDLNPDPLAIVTALRWGWFDVAWGADAVFRLSGLDDESRAVVADYATIKPDAEEELKAVMDSAGVDSPDQPASTVQT